jgi:Cu/Ag efflux protein CusF
MNRVCSQLFSAAIGYNCSAGPVPRISHTLHGTVVAVDAEALNLTVQARRLEDWMGSITKTWHVDNTKVLREVKPGDQIMGKIFDGETALRNVEIVAISARASNG